MPALSIVVFGLGTNLGWRGGFFKCVNCGDSKTLVVFSHSPVDYSYAIPEFLDFFPGNSAHDFVYFGGPLIDSNTQWLVGGGGGYGCDVMGFVWGDVTMLTEVELVKFSVCYFFGECEDSASAPTTGSVVVVVSEGGCGRYPLDRSSCEGLV